MTNAVRDITLPPGAAEHLRGMIYSQGLSILKVLHSCRSIMVDSPRGLYEIDNPFQWTPIDDIAEVLTPRVRLAPPHPQERRRRAPGAPCSIRLVEGVSA